MAEVNINLKCDLQHAVKVQYLDGNLFSQDAAANTINIEVTDNGAPATIGGTVSANVIRPDGGTVAVTGGTISGNIVSITLPAACYALVGMISVIVKLTSDGTETTIAALTAYVYQSSTDTVVDPGTVISSIQDLIDAIDTAVASIPADYSGLWTSLAPAFSSSTAYTAGQYVTYNSGLYRFTKSHAAGSWASGDVVAVNIGGELTDLKSALDNSTLNTSSDKTVQVSSLSRINYWLKEIPPTTAISSSAYSVRYDIEAYRGGRVFIHLSVMGNAAADPKYSWAIADSSNNVLASSAKNNSAQTINDTFVIPNTAKTLWIGTDTTNSSSTYFTLTNTTANTVDEKYAKELNKDILLVVPYDAYTDKNWLTTIPPTSAGYSSYALDKGFDISEYVGRKVNIVVIIMGTGSGTDKYAWAIADASNNILISSTKTNAAQDIDITVTIPTGAKMLWLSTDVTSQKAEATIKANAVKELEKDVSELQERFPVPTYPIICWGDSLTAGAGWVGSPSGYPVVLSEEFGVEVKNAGVGGETSSTIAARMGAIPVIIPAGDINGTYATDAFKDQWGNPVQPLKQDSTDYKKTVNPIVINGEEASLAINTSTNEYTISGYSGDAPAVPVEMTFYGQDLTGIITVICVGQNDTGIALEQIMARIDSMIDHCAGEWLVLGRPTGDAESRATEEAAMLNKYGGRYLNSRHLVSQYGMTIMGLTPTSADETAIASGEIPPSLRYDTVHLNENGYRAWGKFIAMRIRTLGFDKLLP